jgi:hypothetical protein
MSCARRNVCSPKPATACAPVAFQNVRKNITVSYNLCTNQDVLAWGYHQQGACDNSFGFYFAGDYEFTTTTNPSTVENLAVTTALVTDSCMPCSCDSVLFFPEVNVNSTISVVLITQKHTTRFGEPQAFSSNTANTENCFVNLSDRSKYQVWKAVLCGPVQCAQKVEFQLVGDVNTRPVSVLDPAGPSPTDILFDVDRLENMLVEFLK